MYASSGVRKIYTFVCCHTYEPGPGVEGLQAALQAVFPECNDLSEDPDRNITSYIPHLGVGQWPSNLDIDAKCVVSRGMGGHMASTEAAAKGRETAGLDS